MFSYWDDLKGCKFRMNEDWIGRGREGRNLGFRFEFEMYWKGEEREGIRMEGREIMRCWRFLGEKEIRVLRIVGGIFVEVERERVSNGESICMRDGRWEGCGWLEYLN